VELKVWTPLFDLEKEMRSVFDRFPRIFGDSPEFVFRPTTDMVRENGDLVVTVEVPGLDIESDVEVMVEGDVLVIKGEKSAEKELSEKDRYMHERHFGSFERRLPLPDGVMPEAIEATYDKGVLKIKVPMPAETVETVRSIPIKVG
jgi:HSP20 family protein